MGKLINQLPTLKKYEPSSTGVETAPGRIKDQSIAVKGDGTKSYMIGKKETAHVITCGIVSACPFILIGVTDCFHPRWRDAKLARFLNFNDHMF